METRPPQAPLLSRQEKQGMTWREIWHSPVFWMMICIFSLVGRLRAWGRPSYVRNLYRSRRERGARRHGRLPGWSCFDCWPSWAPAT